MTEETRLILEKLEALDTKVSSLDTKIDNVEARLDARINDVDAKVKQIQVTIENDLCTRISIVAECHLDLNRKLDAALRVESEKEMLLLRVQTLESDVRKLKNRLASSP